MEVKMTAHRIAILSSCVLLLLCVVGTARCADKDNPKTAYDFYLSGTASCQEGEYERAILPLRKSVELDPDYYYVFTAFVDVYDTPAKKSATGTKEKKLMLKEESTGKTRPEKPTTEVKPKAGL